MESTMPRSITVKICTSDPRANLTPVDDTDESQDTPVRILVLRGDQHEIWGPVPLHEAEELIRYTSGIETSIVY